ncbi:MAG: hypothetical protein ACI90M_000234 [Candidatus Azotimanducaceae bacterium]|jgi:hypothetical protein
MTSPAIQSGRSTVALLLAIALIGAIGFAGYTWLQTETVLAAQSKQLKKVDETLEKMLGEITRMRLEQTSEGQGPQALLEKLKVYAPLTADARIAEPDFQNALRELKAIVRAFESCGDTAWEPVTSRLREADVKKDFNEIKWLMEIAIRLDEKAGKQIAKDVLQGHRMPFPRLRWWAADLLLSHDPQLAGHLLRQILMTESSRGINLDRAQGSGMQIPDKAAFANTGFNNFVQRYIRSDDKKLEQTLTLLLTRVEHDAITIQECIKELGKRKTTAALTSIKKVYDNPPLEQQNPLFMNICVHAIDQIEGAASVAWLEERLKTAPTDSIAKNIQAVLDKYK